MRRVIFDRWMTMTHAARTWRVAVWRLVRRRRRGAGPWSEAERATLAREMGRVG